MINVSRLPLLLALHEHGTLQAAAHRLHVSPSAASQQLAALAKEAGAPLTEADGRKLRLTDAGRVLVEHAYTLLAELERLYNHLHYLGHLCNATTLKVGDVQGKLLEERVKQINARLTGSRFLRSLLVPGGLRRDLAAHDWLREELEHLREEIVRYVKHIENSDSHLDRLLTTGVLTDRVAFGASLPRCAPRGAVACDGSLGVPSCSALMRLVNRASSGRIRSH